MRAVDRPDLMPLSGDRERVDDAGEPLTVTVIGGGTGSFNLLSGLRGFPSLRINSIVSMMDSGGDSGRLRDEFGVLPPGDLRRCLVALSDESRVLRDLFSFRFDEASLKGRSFGNLFFLALSKILDSPQEAVRALSGILKIRGRVIPVTWNDVHLYAELADGSVVAGEANIDVPKHDPSVPIRRVYLEPRAIVNPEALGAIAESDVIVLAPGDLYTSTIPNLIVDGMREGLLAATAPIVYVMNLMTKYGETLGFAASHHVERIARYGGRVPDAVLAHEGPVPEDMLERYRGEQAHQVKIDRERLLELGVKSVQCANLMSATSFVRHDPVRVGAALFALIGELAAGRA